MKRPKKPTYTSPLREEQAEQTKRRILDAATQIIARSAAGLTIPAVAAEANVAIPTVYRYFATKEALEAGVATHVREQIGVQSVPEEGLDGWVRYTHSIWSKFADQKPAVLALVVANSAREIPDPNWGPRRAALAKALAPSLDGIDGEDRERFIDVVAVLSSSLAGMAFFRAGEKKNASALLEWLIRQLHASLVTSGGDAKRGRRGRDPGR